MRKTICSTVIQLEFLKVEEGQTFLVTIPAECDREEFARVLRYFLHQDGIVLTDTHIDHEFRKEG